MSREISFIVVTASYLLSRSLSGLISEEFGSVKVINDVYDVENVLLSSGRNDYTCICADQCVYKAILGYCSGYNENCRIIPIVCSEKNDLSIDPGLPHLNIYFSRKQAIYQLNRAIKDFYKNEKKEDKHKELTKREKVILQLVAKGLTTKQISEKLNISGQTVSSHRKNISSKLEIKSVSGLTAYAIINGLIELNDTHLQ